MSIIKNIFNKKDKPIKNYADFWLWFVENEKVFHEVVKNRGDIEKEFFDKISPKLAEIKKGYFYLTGMFDENTVELIFSAEGCIENVVFVEELVASAPNIAGWKFTALKPPVPNVENIAIEMGGYKFDVNNMFFYSNDSEEYPDEIDVCVVHNDMTSDNKDVISNGVFIFLDNYLGELDFLNNIDNLNVISKEEAEKELIPIAKLRSFLIWRQKEFVEKYEGVRYNTEEDNYSVFEAGLDNGNKIIALINTKLIHWDRHASHPWIAVMTIRYDGTNNNGMPHKDDFQIMDGIEDEMMSYLIDKEGYLNVGRETGENARNIYFACKDFRKPSKIFYEIVRKYGSRFDIKFDIYKDKYWRTFNNFR